MMELVDDVRLGRPEAAREGNELRRCQRLIAQHQHLRFEEPSLERGEFGIGAQR